MSLDMIEKVVRSFYARKDPGHDCSHAARVRTTAVYLAEIEGGNSEVIELAALLHDIGRETTLDNSHAGSSASLAVSILQKYGYTIEVIEAVKHCIAVHSLETGVPETIEAKILFDADKLDFCGAMGLARLFVICGSQSKPIYPVSESKETSAEEIFFNKMCFFPEKLYTQTARELLADNHQFALEFWTRLRRQVGGPSTRGSMFDVRDSTT